MTGVTCSAPRTTVPARRPWAEVIGYARAVRIGDVVEVSGCSSTDEDGRVIGVGDPAQQMRNTLAALGDALESAGVGFGDVVRTRVFLRRMDDWREAGPVHREIFGAITPASSWFGGLEFVDPDMLVEVEATAVAGTARAPSGA
jgi:enamine deaminase RidA (YjgF/YER057c/UK114 family)